MALQGTGVMAFWNNVVDGGHEEFVEWHVLEHIPERVGITGFMRGRRYVAIEGSPSYFNFYETKDPSVLSSPAYLERLNAPTDWTRANLARFRDSNRTLCAVAASLGRGDGACIETLRLSAAVDRDAFVAALSGNLLPEILRERGIVAVHLLEGLIAASRAGTAEKSLRSQPDQVADWVVLVEAIDADALTAARKGAAGNAAFHRAGAAQGMLRGIYQLQFSLDRTDLDRGSTAPLRWA
jgi:hypothetical protein